MDMFSFLLTDAALAAGSVALFVLAYTGARVATRPARIAAAPASPDLADEPPAVVSLLANRWRLNQDASESTLLDLAARGYLELRQPGNDPHHTTIHLRQPEQPEQLLPYEQRVLHRIEDLAVDGVVPVTALTFREKARERQWNRRLQHEVIADARRRGLSRRRFSATWLSVLTAIAAISATGVAVAATRAVWDDGGDLFSGAWFGLVAFALMSGIAGRPTGERDTVKGRVAAAQWYGVRDWLQAHDEFANLPPAAVAVWDRYLSYGAALGVTRAASEVLDLGLGDRRRVWSSYGGQWRRVRVRYPRLWPRYGKAAPALLIRGAVTALIGGMLLRQFGLPDVAWPELAGIGADPFWITELIASSVLPVIATLLLVAGSYALLGTLADLLRTRTITGEVLWRQVWKSRSQGKNNNSVPWLDYLAVDDGQGERTTAWAFPRQLAPGVKDRDVVRIRVRPWSRRIVELSIVEEGRSRRLRDAAAPDPGPDPVSRPLAGVFAQVTGGLAASLGEPGRQAEGLLTADEVGQALGMPVTGPVRMPVPGPLGSALYADAVNGREVLMVGLAQGRTGQALWRRAARHQQLPEIADGAYLDAHRAVARVGEATVVLTLVGGTGAAASQLPQLLRLAAARVPGQRGPTTVS